MFIGLHTGIVLEEGELSEDSFEKVIVEHLVAEEEDKDRQELLPSHKIVVIDRVCEKFIKYSNTVEEGNFKTKDE